MEISPRALDAGADDHRSAGAPEEPAQDIAAGESMLSGGRRRHLGQVCGHIGCNGDRNPLACRGTQRPDRAAAEAGGAVIMAPWPGVGVSLRMKISRPVTVRTDHRLDRRHRLCIGWLNGGAAMGPAAVQTLGGRLELQHLADPGGVVALRRDARGRSSGPCGSRAAARAGGSGA